MLFATLSIEYPILRETLSHARDAAVTWEQSDITEDGDHRMLVWVDCDDTYDAFDAGLDADPTVAGPSRIVEFDDRRLYQLELTPEGHRASVYPLVIEEAGVLRDVTATHEGWFFRVAFPTEAALERFHAFFVEHDHAVEIRQLYEASEADAESAASQFGLTDRQRETLAAAVDAGYFDIPRSCSLAELADRFDISQNAASERVRRGVKTLIENTVSSGDRSP